MASKLQNIFELQNEATNEITSGGKEWMNFLDSATYSYKYSFNDQILIYAQRPDATAVATMDVWNKKLHRWIKKGSKGNTGEMKGFFLQGKNNQIGTLDKNCEYGIFGEVAKDYKGECELKAGGRLFAKAGKAYIRSCIEGNTYKDYEIEIIKTNYQSRSSEKSMVIKITDKELLAKTGGIIQGMSGSPIIQNGRIIGAVTHVFVNDPTKGFGIYLDWMIEQ